MKIRKISLANGAIENIECDVEEWNAIMKTLQPHNKTHTLADDLTDALRRVEQKQQPRKPKQEKKPSNPKDCKAKLIVRNIMFSPGRMTPRGTAIKDIHILSTVSRASTDKYIREIMNEQPDKYEIFKDPRELRMPKRLRFKNSNSPLCPKCKSLLKQNGICTICKKD